MSAPPYMKLFWGAYHKNTRHLTRDQHGAYFLLIGEAWQRGGSLPDDDRKLAAWALCTPAEWRGMKAVIMDFFVLRRGKWQHDRVREELAAYAATSRKRKEAGKKGGSRSGGKNDGISQASAEQKPAKSESESQSEREGIDPSLSGARAVAKSSKRKAEAPIPDAFPGDDLIREAGEAVRAAGVALDVVDQAARFRAHALTNDRRVRDWPEAFRGWVGIEVRRAPPSKERLPVPAWMGPPEVLACVEAAFDDPERGRAFLCSCKWRDVPERAIVSPNGFTVDTLRRFAGEVLADHGVAILLEPGRAA